MDLLLHARDVQHFLGNARQALGVVRDHLAQALLARVGQVFGEQRVGLADGGQRIADFMRHGGRHAAHGRELLGAQPGLHLAQVVQEYHAPLRRRVVAWRGVERAREPGAHMQAQRIVIGMHQIHVGAQRRAAGKGLLDQRRQRGIAGAGGECKRQLQVRAAVEQQPGRGVGGTHQALAVHGQHAVVEVVDDEVIDLFLQMGRLAALQRKLLFTLQALRELVREVGHQKVARTGQRRLEVLLREIRHALAAGPAGPAQQQQGDAGRGGEGQQQRSQRRGHQDGQGQQRSVVHGAGLLQLQQADHGDVDADQRQPLPADLGRRRSAPPGDAREQRQRQIDRAHRPDQRRGLALYREAQALQREQHHGHQHPAVEKAVPQPHDLRLGGEEAGGGGRQGRGHGQGAAPAQAGPCARCSALQ